MALSPAEAPPPAEFIAASSLPHEVILIRHLLERLDFPQKDPTPTGGDNRTCIAWGEIASWHFVYDAVSVTGKAQDPTNLPRRRLTNAQTHPLIKSYPPCVTQSKTGY